MKTRFLIAKGLFVIFLLFNAQWVTAQVTILFNATMAGRDIKSLSLLQLINNFPEQVAGDLTITVTNNSTNQKIASVRINSVLLKTGNNIIPASRLSSSSIIFDDNESGLFTKRSGLFPEGEIECCFTLILTSKNNQGEIFENCYTLSNVLTTPLELVVPENQDVACNKRPRFTWQPPLPLRAGMRFNFILVKVDSAQSANEAVLTNIPIIAQRNISGFMLQYPAGLPELKEGQKYAWQVSMSDQAIKTQSEIWEFKIQCNDPKKSFNSYRELKPQDDGELLITNDFLRFSVFNSYTAGPLKYEVVDVSQPSKTFRTLPEIQLEKGTNNITIDLRKITGIQDDQEYILKVTMPNGQKLSLRFKHHVAL